MPYEKGGRADKSGNKYEIKWVIYLILRVIEEKIYSVTLEALGEDEQGVDVWINNFDDTKEGQQCKGRNGSEEKWTIGSMQSHNIFKNWKFQLERDANNKVALVSPLSCSLMVDLIDRAKNTDENCEYFYKSQICGSSKRFEQFYKDYLEAMGLNIKNDNDIIKSVDYLKRTFYKQQSDSQLKDIILDKIRLLLVGDEYKIYDTFVSIVVDENILGKKITNTIICKLLKEKDIKFKNLALDKRILPRIRELNSEYRKFFVNIKGELIERKEFDLCKRAIDLGESIIIHGKAGNGKSGCTEAIMDYCEENLIPVIAIKLDKRIPTGNTEKWGQDLGLPASIVHCLHSISKDEKAVLILDQLDALRWTQAHSRDSLLVCTEIINEVTKINAERDKKISIVFVCRSYDLENDNNIKALFESNKNIDTNISYQKIYVDELASKEVEQIIGEKYHRLSNKLKNILKTPSNLYIWTKLNPDKEYHECYSTNHLISEWWKQLQEGCREVNLEVRDVVDIKKNLVKRLDKLGRISIIKKALGNINENALFYLSSNGFLLVESNCISFTHQSILDYFLAEDMLNKYYDGESVDNIIGLKVNQTPSRRYQVQMLLQNVVEIDSQDFISIGEKLLASENIRYYIKHVFYEVLGQVDNIDEVIERFILLQCEDEKNIKYLIENVFMGHSNYLEVLRKNGILDKWINNNDKKDIVFNLLSSISLSFNTDDINFIKKYIFKLEDDDRKFARCFHNDINCDSDEMFDLRIKFYERYPYMCETWIDYKKMFKECEIRTIKYLELLLKNNIRNREREIYRYEELLDETSDIILTKGKEILSILLQYVPCEFKENIIYSKWSAKYGYKNNLERTCIQIIKKANRAVILNNPQDFFDIYREYMGKGFPLFNEIILSSLINFPDIYSDNIIQYLCEDFDKNIFDETSGNKSKLLLVEELIRKYSSSCSEDIFSLLESKIIQYKSPKIKEWYLNRIEYNKHNKGERVYWSFWGDLQVVLLQCLQYKRMSEKAKKLLSVLKRRFKDVPNIYVNLGTHSGSIKSPISGKVLSNKDWRLLLTNRKLERKKNHSWKTVKGGFIESSIQQYSYDFSSIVAAEPERMINLVLGIQNRINEEYINSLFNGIARSSNLQKVSIKLLEKIIIKYKPNNNETERAMDICLIIRNGKDVNWSQEILDILKELAIKHKNPELGKPVVTNNEDKEMKTFDMLESNALNCVRGCAARTIGDLLWKNNKLYYQFKDIIDKLTQDVNPAVKLESLYALRAVYDIEREWAAEKILNLYEQDYRLAGSRKSGEIFFLLYPKYRKRVLEVIQKCYSSIDKQLVQVGAYNLVKMYILKNEFYDEISNIDGITKEQVQTILETAILYFNNKEYNDISKAIILKFSSSEFDLEFPISKLFYENKIDLERDKEFLLEVMNGNLGRRTIYAFTDYLEENSKSMVDYKDIILSISYNLINNDYKERHNYYSTGDEISKLIVQLYDETSIASNPELNKIAQSCLDIWDLMFEKQIGSIRILSEKILER